MKVHTSGPSAPVPFGVAWASSYPSQLQLYLPSCVSLSLSFKIQVNCTKIDRFEDQLSNSEPMEKWQPPGV
jgi:hypothetical protein